VVWVVGTTLKLSGFSPGVSQRELRELEKVDGASQLHPEENSSSQPTFERILETEENKIIRQVLRQVFTSISRQVFTSILRQVFIKTIFITHI
jgi:hypothetical protein